MVLPHRIELWTSSLPMRCSTTELRQQTGVELRGAKRARAGFAIGVRPPQAKLESNFSPSYPDLMSKKPTPADARKEARLAAALRENLKRRKAQARARAEKPGKDEHGAEKPEPGSKRD